MADLEQALTKFWRTKLTRVPLSALRSFFDFEVKNHLSFWEFFVLLALGDARTSFLPLLATNRPVELADLALPSEYASDSAGVPRT